MTYTLHCGDCLDVLPTLEANSVDTVITDPPAGISFMGRAWDSDKGGRDQWINWLASVMREALRVTKPGGMALVWSIPRTSHWTGTALELAGWEVRDVITHLFGSGFPKSHQFAKQMNGHGAEWQGWGTALKPAAEFWWLAMKPLDGTFADNAQRWGVAGLNVDGGRIGTNGGTHKHDAPKHNSNGIYGNGLNGGGGKGREIPAGRWPANLLLDEFFVQTVVLRYNTPDGIKQAIKEYFHDYKLPSMRQRVQDLSEQEQEKQGSILQPGVLRQSTIGEDEGRGASDVWQESYRGIETDNAGEATIEGSQGREESGMEGRAAFGAGLRDDITRHAITGGTIPLWQHGDAQQQKLYTGASASNGAAFGATVGINGGSTPSQREQGRQSIREPGIARQDDTQVASLGTNGRIASLEARERTLEVIASDVPEQWLKYFEPSGWEVRGPQCAAAALDAQSGVTVTKWTPGKRGGTNPGMWSGKKTVGKPQHNDTGGASRFFYVAKASRAERNAGLDDMPQVAVSIGDERPSGGSWERRGDGKAGGPQANTHPTVKPLALMRYLCKLTATPTGGVVLDPFAGSGTTGVAALQEGRRFVGIELDAGYCEIAKRRIEAAPVAANQGRGA